MILSRDAVKVAVAVELYGVVRVSGDSNGHPQARQCTARKTSHREEFDSNNRHKQAQTLGHKYTSSNCHLQQEMREDNKGYVSLTLILAAAKVEQNYC